MLSRKWGKSLEQLNTFFANAAPQMKIFLEKLYDLSSAQRVEELQAPLKAIHDNIPKDLSADDLKLGLHMRFHMNAIMFCYLSTQSSQSQVAFISKHIQSMNVIMYRLVHANPHLALYSYGVGMLESSDKVYSISPDKNVLTIRYKNLLNDDIVSFETDFVTIDEILSFISSSNPESEKKRSRENEETTAEFLSRQLARSTDSHSAAASAQAQHTEIAVSND